MLDEQLFVRARCSRGSADGMRRPRSVVIDYAHIRPLKARISERPPLILINSLCHQTLIMNNAGGGTT